MVPKVQMPNLPSLVSASSLSTTLARKASGTVEGFRRWPSQIGVAESAQIDDRPLRKGVRSPVFHSLSTVATYSTSSLYRPCTTRDLCGSQWREIDAAYRATSELAE